MNPIGIKFVIGATVCLLGVEITPRCLGGPTHEVVWGFSNPPKGPSATSLCLASDGYLWGTAAGAATGVGPSSQGVVYRVKSDGTQWDTVLHFSGNAAPNRGSLPNGGFLEDGAGSIWGTTWGGGSSDRGTVFKINLATHALTTVVDFSGNGAVNKGARPRSRLTLTSDGVLWGTTWGGGASDLGTVFKLDPVSGLLTSIIAFSGSAGSIRGAHPSGPLVSDGGDNLWGVTEGASGLGHGYGTVFKIHRTTLQLTTVIEFSGDGTGNKGSAPNGALHRDGAGNWWGVTTGGGAGLFGTVFKIGGESGIMTTVVEFTGTAGARRGARPAGGLTADDTGFLWGVTAAGGVYDLGSLFKIDPANGAFSNVGSFTGKTGAKLGASPETQLLSMSGGIMWGTTGAGGVIDAGTVFRINSTTNSHETIVEFTTGASDNKGTSPLDALYQDSGGSLWGATSTGGAANLGTLFHFDWASGRLVTDIEFGGMATGRKGALPNGNLLRDSTGRYWGTTRKGGAGDVGTVFVFDPSTHELSTPVDFSLIGPKNLGGEPSAGLLAASDGLFWGTTRLGGAAGGGTIFKIDPQTASLTTVAELGAIAGVPIAPLSGLIDDGHGFLWGSGRAGAGSCGGLFKVSLESGAVTEVIEFTDLGTVPGCAPVAELLAWGPDELWGTSSQGGPGSGGTIFKLNRTSGAFTLLAYFYPSFDFTGNPLAHRGSVPTTPFVDDGMGFLWGTTSQSGMSASGVNGMIFKIDAATGGFATVVEFAGYDAKPLTGSSPMGPVMRSALDGNIYGTTSAGGPLRGGTIYRVRLGPSPRTESATAVSATSATLRGAVNPNGNGDTTVLFEFGADAGLAGATSVGAGVVVNGPSPTEVMTALTTLTPSTTYFYRVTASNSGNPIPQLGKILSFATPSLTPLESWRVIHFGSSLNDGDAADRADPDGDDLPNLVEFGFGLDPRDPASSQLPPWEQTEEGYAVAFAPPAGVGGVVYQVEWTASLAAGAWSTVPDTGVPPLHRFVAPSTGQRELFVRFLCSTP